MFACNQIVEKRDIVLFKDKDNTKEIDITLYHTGKQSEASAAIFKRSISCGDTFSVTTFLKVSGNSAIVLMLLIA